MSSICIFVYVCVFLRTIYWSYLCAALPRLSHVARRVAAEPNQFTGRADLFHLFTTVLPEVTWPPLFQTRARFYDTFTSDFVEWRSTALLWVFERRRARSFWSVCCEGSFGDTRWEWGWVTEWYDWRSHGANPLSHSTVFSPHCDTTVSCLTNNNMSSEMFLLTNRLAIVNWNCAKYFCISLI